MALFGGLLLLCVGMFLGSLLVGYIPMLILSSSGSASSSFAARLRYANAFGAGLFVGTAFSVIVPEGAQLLISNQSTSSSSSSSSSASSSRRYSAYSDSQSPLVEDAHSHEEHEECIIPALFGIPLCLGFVAMMLVERLSHGSPHTHSRSPRAHTASHPHRTLPKTEHEAFQLDRLPVRSKSSNLTTPADEPAPLPPPNPSATRPPNNVVSAFVGLLVHCAADGVALGSVALSDHSSLEMLVFVALMMHKAPAAFGLATFLVKQRRTRPFIWKYLIVFSATSPTAALLTYVMCVGYGSVGSHTLGLLMLFSAGTFLFVACVHILPEIMHESDLPIEWSVLAVICAGTIVPSLLASSSHHH